MHLRAAETGSTNHDYLRLYASALRAGSSTHYYLGLYASTPAAACTLCARSNYYKDSNFYYAAGYHNVTMTSDFGALGIAATPHTAAAYHAQPTFCTFYPAATSATTDDLNGCGNPTFCTFYHAA